MSAHDNYLDPDRHLWPEEPPEWYLTGQKVVFEFFSCDMDTMSEEQAKAACKRRLYKSTDCGAWIEFVDGGIEFYSPQHFAAESGGIILGSIVEGCDFGTATYPLSYDGITPEMIQERIDAIEKEAAAIWEWANRPCDKKGRWRKNGSTTMAELGCDAPDISWDYRHLGQGDCSS